MNLIDTTYFHTSINIPNIDSISVSENVIMFIDEYEPELMLDLLGLNLYQTYLSNPSTQRFVELTNGTLYITKTGEHKKWKGLKNTIGSNKYSLIAYYVYFYITRNTATITTGIGEVLNKTDNANRVSPINKQVDAWNKMVRWIYELYDFLEEKKSIYPEWQKAYCFEENYRLINSMNL